MKLWGSWAREVMHEKPRPYLPAAPNAVFTHLCPPAFAVIGLSQLYLTGGSRKTARSAETDFRLLTWKMNPG